MSRRLSIAYPMIVFAIIFAASGCSSAPNPIPVLPFVVAGVQKTPQSDGSWTTKASMHHARSGPAVGVVNGILYAVGGDNGTAYFKKVESYDPATNTWRIKAHMPTPRSRLAAGVVNGRLDAVGGWKPFKGSLNTVEAYNPVTDTWILGASMPTARYGLAAGVINGRLYAVGGCCDNNFHLLGAVEAYDPVTNTWITEATMPTARYGLAAGVINGKLYAIGGDDGSPLNTVEAFNPR